MTPTPPLSVWGLAWRIVLVMTISLTASSARIQYQVEDARWWLWLDLALGLVSFALMFWRRRLPVTVAVATNLLGCFSLTAAGPATLALFSLATRRRWREIAVAGALSAVAACARVLWWEPLTGAVDTAAMDLTLALSLVLTILVVTVGWGMYAGSRRELVATLHDRAETAESEQMARAAQARIAERARIAREMHDVLAHRISLVTMHAGALTFREDLSPEQIRGTATIIEESSRLALVELREVLGVLREESGDGRPEPPQPTVTAIPDLLQHFRDTGMNLVAEFAIEAGGVPAAIGRTAYRVVQEGLTNAAKHAPQTLVEVSITGGSEDGLLITVSNRIPAGSRHTAPLPGSGLGLIGLTERAELAGGRLTRVMTTDRHVLGVWLPWSS